MKVVCGFIDNVGSSTKWGEATPALPRKDSRSTWRVQQTRQYLTAVSNAYEVAPGGRVSARSEHSSEAKRNEQTSLPNGPQGPIRGAVKLQISESAFNLALY